jgi:hypothetical protein
MEEEFGVEDCEDALVEEKDDDGYWIEACIRRFESED